MPPIFKTLATITAWGLFIFGWVMGLSAFVMGMVSGNLFNADQETPVSFAVFWAVAGFYAVASVVVMLLRKKME